MVTIMARCDLFQYSLFVLIALLLISVYFNLKQRRAIKQSEKNESLLVKKAYFNPITELPNRSNIDIVISEQICRAARHKKSFLVAVIRVINYHDIKLRSKERAEELIVEVSDRILDSIRNEDTLSHITENGFLIVFNEYLEEENSDILFNRINNAFKEKFQHDKGTLEIKIAIGKSKYPDNATQAKGLINEATRQALNSK